MSRLQRRKLDRQQADERLAEADRKIIDLAVRRARFEADIAPFVFQARKKEGAE